MAVSENTGGTLSANGTEQTLATITAAGTYQLVVDLSNMTLGDIVEIRIKVKVRSGSSSKCVFLASYAHAQGADGSIVISPPVPSPFEFVATLEQVAGTNRNYIWSIYEY